MNIGLQHTEVHIDGIVFEAVPLVQHEGTEPSYSGWLYYGYRCTVCHALFIVSDVDDLRHTCLP